MRPEEQLNISPNEPRHEKFNVLVSDLVRHKPGCTATEDGLRLDFSDLLTMKLICPFVFAYAKSRFSHDVAQIIQL